MDAFFRDLQFKLKKKSKHQPGENSCVLWTGNVSYSGYGLQSVKWPVEGRKLEKAHRVALMVERGLTRSQFRDVEGEVSHLCHNKLCVALHKPGADPLLPAGALHRSPLPALSYVNHVT